MKNNKNNENHKRPRKKEEGGLYRFYRSKIKLTMQEIDGVWKALKYEDPEFEALENGHFINIQTPDRANIEDSEGQSLLVRAVEHGNVEIVQYLISQGANVNWQDDNGNSVLHIAVEEENPEIIMALLNAGADINHRDLYHQKTALENSDYKMLELLLGSKNSGIDIKKTNELFISALENADYKILEVLLGLKNSGIDINARLSMSNPNIWPVLLSPLFLIFNKLTITSPHSEEKRHSYIECLKVLIKNGADILSIDDQLWKRYVIDFQNQNYIIGTKILEEAQKLGYYPRNLSPKDLKDLALDLNTLIYQEYSMDRISLYYKIIRYKYFIDHGKNIDFDDIQVNAKYDYMIYKMTRDSFYHFLTELELKDLKYMLRYDDAFLGYFSAISNLKKLTSLHNIILNICKNKTSKVMQILDALDFKIDGYTPLSILFGKDVNLYFLSCLINKGIDANEADFLLSSICKSKYRGPKKISAINLLIENGADVSGFLNNRSPLFYARGDIEALYFLLKSGARVNAVDRYSKTVLDHIYKLEWNKYAESVKLLIYYGAKFNHKTLARENNIKDITEEVNKFIQDYTNDLGKMLSDNPLTKYALNNFNAFTAKLSTILDGKAKSSSKKSLELPKDIIKYIALYFNPEETLNFLPVCKGRGTTYSKYKSKTTLLEENGKKVVDVEGDGNCFFRAVEYGIEGREGNHLAFRAMAVAQLRANPERYFHDGEDVEEYIAKVRNDENWIDDHRIIHAMADALQMNIHIHNTHGVDVTISPTYGDARKTIEVLYTGNHYMSVVSELFNPLEGMVLDDRPLEPLRSIVTSNNPYNNYMDTELSEMDWGGNLVGDYKW